MDAISPTELIGPTVESPRRRNLTPAAEMVIGALSIALLPWIHRTSERQATQQLRFDKTIAEVE